MSAINLKTCMVGLLAAIMLTACGGGGPEQRDWEEKEILSYQPFARVTAQGVSFSVTKIEFLSTETRIHMKIFNRSGSYFDLDEGPGFISIVGRSARRSMREASAELWQHKTWGQQQPPNTTVEGVLTFPPIQPQVFKLIVQGRLGNPPIDRNRIRVAITVDLPLERPKY